MTFIQLAALDLQAMVRHGNTLSNEMWESRPTPQLRYFDRDIRELQAIEKAKQLFTDIDAFFADDNSDTGQEILEEVADIAAPENEDATPDEPGQRQQSLLESETFSGSETTTDTDGKSQQRRTDIVLPDARQLGLFDNVNDG